VIFCPNCRTTRLDGPERCPRCEGRYVSEAVARERGWLDEAETETSPPRATSPSPEEPRRRGSPGTPITFQGETLTVLEWAERLGWPATTIYSRIREERRSLGRWPVDRMLTVPPHVKVARVEGPAIVSDSATVPPDGDAGSSALPTRTRLTVEVGLVAGDKFDLRQVVDLCRRVVEIDREVETLRLEQRQIVGQLQAGDKSP
jgi:hypothetical protein